MLLFRKFRRPPNRHFLLHLGILEPKLDMLCKIAIAIPEHYNDIILSAWEVSYSLYLMKHNDTKLAVN